MLETSCVDFGYRTRRGTCSGSAKDSGVEDLDAHISGREVDSMFGSPSSSPSMFSLLWLYDRDGASERGSVDLEVGVQRVFVAMMVVY